MGWRALRIVPARRTLEGFASGSAFFSAGRIIKQRVPDRGWQQLTLDKSTSSGVRCARQPANRSEMTMPSALAAVAWRGVAFGFFPRGFPSTVTENYLPYVQWTALSLLTGRVQSVLATQAALFTVGLGSGAIPMAAAIQWVLKDGIGDAGAIAYAAAVNTRFDADAKRYRFQATCALTLADFMAVCMPLAPQYFLVMASTSRWSFRPQALRLCKPRKHRSL